MSNIADGIEFALAESRKERAQTKVAEIGRPSTEVATLSAQIGAGIKQAAQALLAADDEDVTVGDLQSLMRQFQ